MRVLYEDNHIIVVVKPQNLPSQADSSGDADMLSLVKDYVKLKYGKPGEVYIGLLHRLDRPAGGVMVFARTSKAAARLSAQIRAGGLKKLYYALVEGELAPSATLTDWLVKDGKTNNSRVAREGEPGAKYAELSYSVVERKAGVSLLRVELKTGRAHQIRVQLANAGAPLTGDFRYGGKKIDKLCLWSYLIGFEHPTKREWMEFCCAPPREEPWTLFSFAENELQRS